MINKRYKTKIISVIRKHIGNDCSIYLFGSRARGDNFPGSDVDIALDSGSVIPDRIIEDIKKELSDKTTIPFKIDVVDLTVATPASFKEEIMRDKILWSH